MGSRDVMTKDPADLEEGTRARRGTWNRNLKTGVYSSHSEDSNVYLETF